jgi:hypothetical protein
MVLESYLLKNTMTVLLLDFNESINVRHIMINVSVDFILKFLFNLAVQK